MFFLRGVRRDRSRGGDEARAAALSCRPARRAGGATPGSTKATRAGGPARDTRGGRHGRDGAEKSKSNLERAAELGAELRLSALTPWAAAAARGGSHGSLKPGFVVKLGRARLLLERQHHRGRTPRKPARLRGAATSVTGGLVASRASRSASLAARALPGIARRGGKGAAGADGAVAKVLGASTGSNADENFGAGPIEVEHQRRWALLSSGSGGVGGVGDCLGLDPKRPRADRGPLQGIDTSIERRPWSDRQYRGIEIIIFFGRHLSAPRLWTSSEANEESNGCKTPFVSC